MSNDFIREPDADVSAVDPLTTTETPSDNSAPPTPPWWETPASEYRHPVAVDPAIYGIDADDGDLESTTAAQDIAKAGLAGSGSSVPFLRELQASFGAGHDLSSIVAHVGPEAAGAADAIGANAYATSGQVAFGAAPDPWTVAHEVTHVLQQRAGLAPAQGVGAEGDAHEQQANAVADTVSRGGSARSLLSALDPKTAREPARSPFAGLFDDDSVSAKPLPPDQTQLRLDQSAPPGSVVQLDRKKRGAKPSTKTSVAPSPQPAPPAPAYQPKYAPDSTAQAFLGDGRVAVANMQSAVQQAGDLYSVVKKTSFAKATQEQNTQNYKETSDMRADMVKVSTFEKVLNGVTAAISFGTSIASVVSAARTLYSAAKEFREVGKLTKQLEGAGDAYTLADRAASMRLNEIKTTSKNTTGGTAKSGGSLVKDGISVGKTVGEAIPDGKAQPDKPLDKDTMLADSNAAAIEAASLALISVARETDNFSLSVVHGFAKGARANFANMVQGIGQLHAESLMISPASLAEFHGLLKQFEKLEIDYVASLERVRAILSAYDAGGAAGLADAKELGVYEAIQKWVVEKDPKAKQIHFALDQDQKQITFSDVTVDVEAKLGASTSYYCYQYRERDVQSENATLYATDAAAIAALQALGLPIATNSGLGSAETDANKKGGLRFHISASIAKAIQSLGIPGHSNPAMVQLTSSTGVNFIQSPQNGRWFDNWTATGEFVDFWKTHLGGEYAYVLSSDGERKTIPAAMRDSKIMDRSSFSTMPGATL